ncbi:MAG: polysaccharide biosynthesis/export family protein [Candidatus Sedimenticola sp. PURPLELP]
MELFRNRFIWLFALLISTCAVIAETSDYRLLEGDVITISVWGEDDLKGEARVTPSGRISFPLAGSVEVRGKTTAEVEEIVEKSLGKYIPDAQVSVVVVSTQGNKVYVLGKVGKPGVVQMDSPMTVLQALAMVGGPNKFAEEDKIHVYRNSKGSDEVQLKVHYSKLMSGEDMSSNHWLQAGDTILVP